MLRSRDGTDRQRKHALSIDIYQILVRYVAGEWEENVESLPRRHSFSHCRLLLLRLLRHHPLTRYSFRCPSSSVRSATRCLSPTATDPSTHSPSSSRLDSLGVWSASAAEAAAAGDVTDDDDNNNEVGGPSLRIHLVARIH